MLPSDKVDFKLKLIKRCDERHIVFVKGKTQVEISILNTYTLSTRTSTLVKQILIKLKLHNKPHILIVESLNPVLTSKEDFQNKT